MFHMSVTKLLYLSKWARPDIILIVGFLCSRVKGPTKQDWKTLLRVLGYLKETKGWMMKMKPKDIFRMIAYIDASFSALPDGKSQSGMVVRVGRVSEFFGSKKQKCISKTPTKAKLDAVSNNIGFVELHGELSDFMLNVKNRKPFIYHDNTLVIKMVTTGGDVTRAKHMHTRMYLVLEAVKEK